MKPTLLREWSVGPFWCEWLSCTYSGMGRQQDAFTLGIRKGSSEWAIKFYRQSVITTEAASSAEGREAGKE